MEEIGLVVETYEKKKQAKVSFSRKMQCENCNMCLKRKDDMRVYCTLDNKIGAKVGDEVRVEMGSGYVVTAAFIVYIIPLVLSGLSLIFTRSLVLWVQLTIFCSILLLSFGIVFSVDRVIKNKKNFAPRIIEITATQVQNDCLFQDKE